MGKSGRVGDYLIGQPMPSGQGKKFGVALESFELHPRLRSRELGVKLVFERAFQNVGTSLTRVSWCALDMNFGELV
jgi:hypothetical protein